MHCSVMGREALQAAVANYRGETWRDDHEEGALVCKCFAIDATLIEDTVRANNLTSVQDVTNFTKAGGGCSSCHEGIEEILAKVMAERGEQFRPAPVAPAKAAPKPGKLNNLERIRRIEQVIESVRPTLQRDHGDLELIDVDGKTVYVSMTGACAGCQMESVTLAGIQQKLVEELNEMIRVVPTRAGDYARACGV
jgi:NifU-like protein